MDTRIALGVNNAPINALGSFAQGEAQAQGVEASHLQHAKDTIEMVGAGAMHALNGDPNGEVDPVKYGEVMDSFEKLGVDVSKFRDNPEFAKVAVHASMGALNELGQANNERDYKLIVDKWQHQIEQDAAENKLAQDKLAMDAAGNSDTGLVPVYGRDKDGNVVVLQTTKDGRTIRSEMPDGVTIDLGVKSQEGAAGKAVGEVKGAAEAALATAPQAAEEVADKIKAIVNDPDLGVALGPIDSSLPNWTERSNRVQGKIDQLKGIAFLQARQMLKGGGAITDFEGDKAEKAWARLGQAQSEEDFKTALNDFNDAVQAGVKKLKAQASLDRQGGGGGAAVSDDNDPMGIR